MPDDTALIISPTLKQRGQSVLQALKASHMSIVRAESCTAGTIAAVLSRMDGAGDVLHGGFVTYTKEQKVKALGVSAQLLKDHGAVNEQPNRKPKSRKAASGVRLRQFLTVGGYAAISDRRTTSISEAYL